MKIENWLDHRVKGDLDFFLLFLFENLATTQHLNP